MQRARLLLMDLIISHSPEETEAAGRRLAAALRPGDVVALTGDLGAGKTAFTRGLAAGLGCGDAVSSPTFTLIQEYGGGRLPLYHMDLYRLESVEEAIRIGIEEYLEGDGVAVIEWAEKFPDLLPPGTRRLRFRIGPGNQREIAG